MQTIYVDTSFFGGCFDEEFKEWSNKLMQSFTPQKHLCILSDLTLLELENAPENVKDILEGIPNECKALAIVDQEGRNLASAYIEAEAVTQKYYNDALHIARNSRRMRRKTFDTNKWIRAIRDKQFRSYSKNPKKFDTDLEEVRKKYAHIARVSNRVLK